MYYISDDKFAALMAKLRKVDSINSLTISYMMRLIEGFRILVAMRCAELLKSLVRSTNSYEIFAAGIIARSLLELVVRNLEVANMTYHNFQHSVAWDHMKKDVLIFSDHEVNGKRQDGLMTYVEKLLFGTRIKGQTGESERLSAKNIISILEKYDKKIHSKAGYTFFDKYEALCEIAHPNKAGFEYFVSEKKSIDGFWDSFKVGDPTWNQIQTHYLVTVLWVASFCAGTFVSTQSVYDSLTMFVAEKVPKIYPIRKRPN